MNSLGKKYSNIMFLLNDYLRKNISNKKFDKNIAEGVDGKVYQKEKLVCSLTTIPSRVEFVKFTILSILHQTIRPDIIVLYLGRTMFDKIELPEDLLELKKHGLEIRYVDDLEVHTKYYYAFRDFIDCLVMTVDDDIIYNPKLVENLLKKHRKHPTDVICSRAHRISFNEDCTCKPYNNWLWDSKSSTGNRSLVATGVGGVLYVPSRFDGIVFNSELFLELSPHNDDLWLKAVEIVSDIKVVTLRGRQWFSITPDSQAISLNSKNVHQNRNDVYWKQLCDYFDLKKDKFI